MDQCQIDGIDELKIPHDVHHEPNMKSNKHNINIKKNAVESDHRTPKRKSDMSNSNILKKKKKYETALAAIFPENDQSYSQYAQDYAEGYMKKMRERLDTKSFDLAIKLIVSFGVANESNINLLYQQITEVFTDKNEDLIYEFLGFLLPGQALSIGKLTDFLELNRIKEFIRKLQVCMKKHPTQVRKILDNLFHLSKIENITPLEVHTSMLSLLKSNPILVDCFFQLIPTEHPPESFFSDDNWEDLDIDQSINCGIDYEEIIPSDSEDHIISNVCQCICHKSGNNTHCRSCGLKFFKGRIYFDTPEGLKLAKINFEGADPSIVQSKIDKTEENITVKRKSRKGLTKNNSPGSAEDIKGSTGTESEEDLIDIKPKKRQKSKVVQSLKLKFKKDESPKFKEDQETYNNEVGKSIVHITNEELDSSEMVFFCIPKAEPSIKILPKKKLKVDIRECLVKKEHEIFDQIKCLNKMNNLNSVECENKNEISINDSLDKDIISKEIKTEFNCILSTDTVDNIPDISNQFDQYQIPTENKKGLINQSSIIKSNFLDNFNQSCNTNNEKSSDTINDRIVKIEESPKFKEDQEAYKEVGKSIVHITNEELNSSEMVFFCIPNAEPSIKILPKKKLKVDIRECLVKKEHDIFDKIKCLDKMNNLNSVECENKNKISINDSLDKNIISKEIKTEFNCILSTDTVDNIPDISKQFEQYQMPTENKKGLINQSSIIKSNFLNNFNQSCNKNEKSSDTMNKQIVKIAVNNDLDSNISNKKQCEDQNILVKSTPFDCCSTTATIDTPLFNENKIMNVESTENLPERFVDIGKQNGNKCQMQPINKWTIDEDKIILQTCKRVEDIEVLLETINRRIPQRSVSEIQERFTTLMTLLEQMIDVKQN